jgi:hypothetical protein
MIWISRGRATIPGLAGKFPDWGAKIPGRSGRKRLIDNANFGVWVGDVGQIPG